MVLEEHSQRSHVLILYQVQEHPLYQGRDSARFHVEKLSSHAGHHKMIAAPHHHDEHQNQYTKSSLRWRGAHWLSQRKYHYRRRSRKLAQPRHGEALQLDEKHAEDVRLLE